MTSKQSLYASTSANLDEGARPNVHSHGFWRDGQNAYFDVRMTNPDNKSQQETATTDDSWISHSLECSTIASLTKKISTPVTLGRGMTK